MKKNIYLFMFTCFLSGAFIARSAAQDRNFVVHIQMDTAYYKKAEKIYMHSFWVTEHLIVDSAYFDGKKPCLTMQGYTNREHQFYLLFEKEGPLSLSFIAKPNDDISIEITPADDKGGFLYKKVLNSPSTNEMAEIKAERNEVYRKKQALERRMSSGISGKENNVKLLENSIQALENQLNSLAIKTLHNAKSPINVRDVFMRPEISSLPKDSFNILLGIAKRRFPDYPEVQSIGISSTHPKSSARTKKDSQKLRDITLARVLIKNNMPKKRERDPQIGDMLSFTLPDNQKDSISISDIDNKYIIIDFWASWSNPCIKGIEHLKAIHRKYKNCTICCVSIDKNRNDWKNAISRLEMSAFVNLIAMDENKGLMPEIEKLNIQSIPKIFLLNEEKKIIGIDMSPDELEKELSNDTR